MAPLYKELQWQKWEVLIVEAFSTMIYDLHIEMLYVAKFAKYM